MITKLLTTGLVVLIPLAGNATEIRQRPYGFPHEVAGTQESDTFVVCADCPDDRLSLLPAPPKLALRLGTNAPQQLPAPAGDAEAKPKSGPAKGGISCLLGTVLFPFDSAALPPGERARLDGLIGELPAGAIVNLDGYTCDLGSSRHNRELSLGRARAVASYLEGKGVALGRVAGKGECCPVSDERRLNRRVEINTERKEEQ